MDKRRVLLLCAQSLLGESIEHLLRRVEDVELVGPCEMDDWTLTRLALDVPDIVLVVEDQGECESEAAVMSEILEGHFDLPVVRIGWKHNGLRLYTCRTLPATSAALMELICSTPARQDRLAV